MQVVEPSGQKVILAGQIVLLTLLKLVTFGKRDDVNQRLKKKKEEYKEISLQERI